MKKKSINTQWLHTFPALLILASILIISGVSTAADKKEWDKTFPKSDKVIHEKVSYPNRYGITISADMYLPKNIDKSKNMQPLSSAPPMEALKNKGPAFTRRQWLRGALSQ